jgi:hypothetical protein
MFQKLARFLTRRQALINAATLLGTSIAVFTLAQQWHLTREIDRVRLDGLIGNFTVDSTQANERCLKQGDVRLSGRCLRPVPSDVSLHATARIGGFMYIVRDFRILPDRLSWEALEKIVPKNAGASISLVLYASTGGAAAKKERWRQDPSAPDNKRRDAAEKGAVEVASFPLKCCE